MNIPVSYYIYKVNAYGQFSWSLHMAVGYYKKQLKIQDPSIKKKLFTALPQCLRDWDMRLGYARERWPPQVRVPEEGKFFPRSRLAIADKAHSPLIMNDFRFKQSCN